METENDSGEKQKLPVEEWLAIRREEALRIDPEIAEIKIRWAYIPDPYGVFRDLQDEEKCVGRVYFARNPGSDIWVCFYDLPRDVREQLWARPDQQTDVDDDLPF